MPKLTILLLAGLFLNTLSVFGQQTVSRHTFSFVQLADRERNFRDQYHQYRAASIEQEKSPEERADAYLKAVANMSMAGLIEEFDEYTNLVLENRKHEIPLVTTVAQVLTSAELPHQGRIIGQSFTRGYARGKNVFTAVRDRIMALRILYNALPQANRSTKKQQAEFYLSLSDALMFNNHGRHAWQLQHLSELQNLPDYAETLFTAPNDAPVDKNGDPILYKLPANFDSATNDGERWRFALRRAEEAGAVLDARLRLAEFLDQQFGVQTLGFSNEKEELPLLRDEEAYARLANGVKRFHLPDEFNPIKIYRSLVGTPHPQPYLALAEIYNRRIQYTKAAKILRQWLDEHGDAAAPTITKLFQEITDNTASLEPAKTFTAKQKPFALLKYRNAQNIDLILRRFNTDDFFKVAEQAINEQKFPGKIHNFEEIINILPLNQREALLGPALEQWIVKLNPGTEHLPQEKKLELPPVKPGVYLLSGRVPELKEFSQIICVSESALTVYSLGNRTICHVTDSSNGKPLPGHTVEFMGWLEPRRNHEKREVAQFSATTDADGMIILDSERLKKNYNYVIKLRDSKGHTSFAMILKYRRTFYQPPRQEQLKIFGVSDCPIYKPGETVNFQFWLRDIVNDNEKLLNYAGHDAEITVITGRGAELHKKIYTFDEDALLAGSFILPDDVELGRMNIMLNLKSRKSQKNIFGSINCSVEEYRRPEYEVTIKTPDTPVMQGDKFSVTVQAEYYFGAPVTQALVKYKIVKNSGIQLFNTRDDWEWLYEKTMIYPPFPRQPSELVMSGIAQLNNNGSFTVEIETAAEKQTEKHYGQEYKISAEVIDASQRSISANTTVVATAAPFFATIDFERGYASVNTEIEANIRLRTADGKTASGNVSISLQKLEGDTETTVKSWEMLPLDSEGLRKLRFCIADPGMFRLRAVCTSASGYRCSGTSDIAVIGNKNGIDYSFKELEIKPEHKFYKPGDTAELLISSKVKNGTIFWVARANDPDAVPEMITLQDGHATRKIIITADDQPNIFSYVIMVHDGKLSTAACQLKIPPRGKTLNVEIMPEQTVYQPGAESALKVKITDENGAPVQGKFAITVYDKALEYIGGTQNQDIRQAFWGWRRSPQFPNYSFSMNYIFPGSEQLLSLYGFPQSIAFGTSDNLLRITTEKADNVFLAAMSLSEETRVRSDFRTGAYWQGKAETDQQGLSIVRFTLPDSLTTWKAIAWAVDAKCAAGQGKTEFTVKKDFFVRINMPRFLIAGDNTFLTALIHNYTSTSKAADVEFTVDHNSLAINPKPNRITVNPDSYAKTEQPVKAILAGSPDIVVKAAASGLSDAVKLKLPILNYGLQQRINVSGKIEAVCNDSRIIPLKLPADVTPDTSKISVSFTTSPASAMITIIPYLLDEKNCDVFSVANRFIALSAAGEFLKPFYETNTALPEKYSQAVPEKFKSLYDRKTFLRLVAKASKQLKSMQNSDGGWGWFGGYYGTSRAETTAYAIHALNLTRKSGIAFDEAMLREGVEWLKAYRKINYQKPDQVNDLGAMVNLVLTEAGFADEKTSIMFFENRSRLSLHGLATLALSTTGEQQKMLLRNLDQFVDENQENLTAYLNAPENVPWWNWWHDELAATAAYLKLLSTAEPQNQRNAMIAKFLIENRNHAALESGMRQNAVCLEALTTYLRTSKELDQAAQVEIKFDKELLIQTAVKPDQLVLPPQSVTVEQARLTPGEHHIKITRSGTAPVYFSIDLSYFNQEKPLPKAGSDLKISRRYYLLEPEPLEKKVSPEKVVQHESWRRTPLLQPINLKVGNLIETELIIEAANDYDYIVIQDGKAAGLEPVEIGSGYRPDFSGAYVELYYADTRFYLRNLKRGTTVLSYRLKAESKGSFCALPAIARSSQSPRLQGNSDSAIFTIND